jgi:transcriptional regulator with XRE-family HTH domain
VSRKGKVDELAFQIGARIRTFREEHSLTQQDLSERTGVPRQQIGRYELGIEVPRLRNAIAIARFMDILVDELINGNREDDIAVSNPVLRECFLLISRMTLSYQNSAVDLLEMFIASRQQPSVKFRK